MSTHSLPVLAEPPVRSMRAAIVRRCRQIATYTVLPAYVGGISWLLVRSTRLENHDAIPLCVLGVFVLALTSCCALEWVLPFRREWNRLGRQEWNDFGHLFVQVLPSEPVARGLILLVLPVLVAEEPGRYWPVHWPVFLQVALVLIVQEIAGYAFHRLSHSVPWLWRFHRFHHTSERLTATKQFRQSFVEGVFDAGILLIVASVAGFPPNVMAWVVGIAIPLGLIQHSNIDARTPRFFNRFLITPAMHRIHHARCLRDGNSNFGIGLSLFDVLFGTFTDSDVHCLGPLGLPQNSLPASFWGQVLAPFRWDKLDRSDVKLPGGE